MVLPATVGGDKAYTISASNQKQDKITLNDVLFGDVWFCGGQSNMQFAVSQVKPTWLTIRVYITDTLLTLCKLQRHIMNKAYIELHNA